ncbi:mas-related G-protein coupled receptor member H-like [Tiliqua scincoides]|uniref:mas-related G-protein coupled receptor member H-like n=1 Tax=Tiliqua scincoides TaxID=71010 RepID=UPI0034625116
MPKRFIKRNIQCFICVVCIFGLVGNGAVIWLLGLRTPFTTYVLHLAVADYGVLESSVSEAVFNTIEIHPSVISLAFCLYAVNGSLFHAVYSTSQFLLTAISIDHCVFVLFPLWYRCHQPEKLSTFLCALIWLLSFLVQGICLGFNFMWTPRYYPLEFYAFLVNSVVCLPLITVSTLILFVRFCFKSQQNQQGKLITTILLTLFFLIFAFPLNVIYLITFNPRSSPKDLFNLQRYDVAEYGWLCASLNSFVNPLLYFLTRKKKRGLCRENLILQSFQRGRSL